mgnify:CR=1 FL=1
MASRRREPVGAPCRAARARGAVDRREPRAHFRAHREHTREALVEVGDARAYLLLEYRAIARKSEAAVEHYLTAGRTAGDGPDVVVDWRVGAALAWESLTLRHWSGVLFEARTLEATGRSLLLAAGGLYERLFRLQAGLAAGDRETARAV